MDELDAKILRNLQQNARMTVSEISTRVGLSAPAVSERLKKLETSGLIAGYTAIVDQNKLGLGLTALMMVGLERPQYIDSFNSYAMKETEIIECYYLAGDFDYHLKIITESTATLERLLHRIKSVPGVRKTRTTIVLSSVKQRYSVEP